MSGRIKCPVHALLSVLLVFGIAACDTISHPALQALTSEYEQASRTTPQSTAQSVFVDAAFIRGHNHSEELSKKFDTRIREHLTAAGYEITPIEDDADLVVSTSVRGWWAYHGRSALISFVTLTVYTPLYYRWAIDVHVYGPDERPVASALERGKFTYRSFFIVLFPSSLYQGFTLIPPEWQRLVDASATVVERTVIRAQAGGRD
ncbi:MAG: hypothetical protein ACYSXF_07555 [Planctomycetota bacterium]|jgi:hypothetical protein